MLQHMFLRRIRLYGEILEIPEEQLCAGWLVGFLRTGDCVVCVYWKHSFED